jgi:membrane protein
LAAVSTIARIAWTVTAARADPLTIEMLHREQATERPAPDEAPLEPPKRSRVAILRGGVKAFNDDHMTNIAAALAYYAFLTIPAALLVAVGLFGLLAGPHAVTTLVGKLNGVMPAQATSLIKGSLTNVTQHRGTGLAVLAVGSALALWTLSSAMQALMWALNTVYDRDESRGFVRRRVIALGMVGFAFLGFALALGVLVLGPHLSSWIGDALGIRSVVKPVWYVAEWPVLVAGLLVTFAGLMYLGPDVQQRNWRLVSLGSVLAIVIWLVASAAFAFYASSFGSYNKAWGSLAAVAITLTWLWLSNCALLLGAEIDAEAERQG